MHIRILAYYDLTYTQQSVFHSLSAVSGNWFRIQYNVNNRSIVQL
jgi:hypothetical protein